MEIGATTVNDNESYEQVHVNVDIISIQNNGITRVSLIITIAILK